MIHTIDHTSRPEISVGACSLFITVLCTKEWRSAARGCGQQIEGHESFLVTSGLNIDEIGLSEAP